ncbi:MAG: LytTR family transcriptional regulator DNA-binding domain-containing protein [Saprospiraceae bacterium]
MKNLIIYKKGHNLGDNIERKKLDISNDFKIYFLDNEENLLTLMKNTHGLVLIFTDDFHLSERILIRKIKNQYLNFKVALFTDQSYALDAWKMNLFHFEEHPVKVSQVNNTIQKYLKSDTNFEKFISLKTDDGVIKLGYNQICYIHASGNYSIFNLVNDKFIVQTKQISQFDYCCTQTNSMNRIHRSFLINFQNIEKIGNDQIWFHGRKKSLRISNNLFKKLRKQLLGFTQ